MSSRSASIATIVYLALCTMLGGATLAGHLAHGFLQALGVCLMLFTVWKAGGYSVPPEGRLLVWTFLLYVLLVVLTLVPLPPGVWRSLPGREVYAEGLDLLGAGQSWQPISLGRDSTIASLLSIIPPLTVFLLVAQMREEARRRLSWLVVALAVVSVVLGAFQLLQGQDSPLRFYEVTSVTLPVGFFSNANHLATLTLFALPFCGYLAARGAGRGASRGSSRTRRSSAMLVAVAIGLFLCAGVAIIGSLAGYILFPISAVASVLVYRRAMGRPLTRLWLAGLAAAGLLFVGAAVVGSTNEELFVKKEASLSSRQEFAARTGEAIADHSPVGTGLGTFANVYRLYDDPTRTDRHYVNHAHNDYLELVLELGWAGALLILAFILWWGRRTLAVWRTDFRGADLARAASVPIGLVLLHSVVDYPARTAAIAALMGMCCALMLPPRGRTITAPESDDEEDEAPTAGLRHLEAD